MQTTWKSISNGVTSLCKKPPKLFKLKKDPRISPSQTSYVYCQCFGENKWCHKKAQLYLNSKSDSCLCLIWSSIGSGNGLVDIRKQAITGTNDGPCLSTVPKTGPIFCLLLGVRSGCARPIAGQVTSVTWPVIGRAWSELTLSKGPKTGHSTYISQIYNKVFSHIPTI